MGPRCLAAGDVAARVVRHKTLYFRDTWSRYDDVLSGGLRLAPDPDAVNGLRSDYAQMRPMFFNEPLEFHHILTTLARLEETINRR